MRWPSLPLLLLLATLASAAGYTITPDRAYASGSGSTLTVYIPDTAVAGVPSGSVTNVTQPAACSAACRAAGINCTYFRHCGDEGGCAAGVDETLPYRHCQLLNGLCPNGSLPLTGTTSNATSGFPLEYLPETLNGIQSIPAQGILGADFNCSVSVVPGVCALRSTFLALFICVSEPACQAISVLQNGTDGCSQDSLSILKSQAPTPSNSYIAPQVFTLVVPGNQAEDELFLLASEAEVELPSAAEEQAAEAPGSAGSSYLGCSVAQNALLVGTVVGLVDDVPSAADCCRACQQRGDCNVFNYCQLPGGCSYQSSDVHRLNVTLAAKQCQLREQQIAGSTLGAPVLVIAKGEGVNFTAGAPVAVSGPQLPSYERLLGTGLFAHGRYPPETAECVLGGTPEQLAQDCTSDPQCAAVTMRLGNFSLAWTQPTTEPFVGFLRNISAEAFRLVTPTAVLYIRNGTQPDGGGGGLSAGAIAGIAVGCAAVLAALVCGVWLLRRRRRRRAPDAALPSSPASSPVENGCGSKDLEHASSEVSFPPPPSLPSDKEQHEQLPELLTFVAQREAAAPRTHPDSDASSSPREPRLLDADALPANLREWVVDSSAVRYLRRPDGRLWELGCGATAHVYKVLYNGEVVAAKEMQIGGGERAVFLTEAMRLQQLRHPNVVGFMGVALAGDKGVVLLEFCEGRDLYNALEVVAAGTSERLFGWHRRGRRAALEVSRALNYIHSKGVVHLDIKSPNILLTAAGTAKLTDVGFSRLQTHSFLSDVHAVGTFAWIAPEVLLGTHQCTAAVDIYSFGVVLWELITGQRPVRGQLRLPRVPEECPQEASDLMLQCLDPDPVRRPTSQQLMQRLSDLQLLPASKAEVAAAAAAAAAASSPVLAVAASALPTAVSPFASGLLQQRPAAPGTPSG